MLRPEDFSNNYGVRWHSTFHKDENPRGNPKLNVFERNINPSLPVDLWTGEPENRS
ncbi:hypothetical protein [Dapis sp. BLCC M229]|uniref:hypothetical protein n=1 Tax=Dapis sp. BLCC M229 TaxID=3400188 RepID=UPI003CF72772